MPAIKSPKSIMVPNDDLPKPRNGADTSAHGFGPGMKTLRYPIQASFRKIEIGDLLLFFYILALTRQCLWVVSNNLLAWVLSILIALSLWCFGLSKKEPPLRDESLSYWFYLIVALPLFVIYVMRIAFPDVSFDVLNYHMIAAERSLRGFPFGAHDFLPIDFPVNPLPDMVTGIYRHLLGYRVGTIVNYLTLVWVATILVKLLRHHLKRAWLICLAVLLIVLTETLLFEINNYMVDLLTLPLLLQATYLVLYAKEQKTIGYDDFCIAFLLGLSIAFKLTNVGFVVPILLVWTKRMFDRRVKLNPVLLTLLLVVLIAPALPYTLHLYKQTGNPVFPFYNGFFKSPYADFTNFDAPEWGPQGLKQALIWPLLLYWKTQRISEIQVYAGKIPIGFVLAFFFLLFKRVGTKIRALSFIAIVGALLWSLTVLGAPRYGFYLEMISGILIIYLSRFIAENLNIRGYVRSTLSLFPWAVLATLATFSLYYVYHYEWSLRPTFFENPQAYLRQSRLLFRDYSLKSFLSPQKAAVIDDVEVWIKFAPLVSTFEGLLRPDIPSINLRSRVFLQTPEAKDRFSKVLYDARNKRMFSLCYVRDLGGTIDSIAQLGLGVGKITTVSIPYFEYDRVYYLGLIEVLPPPENGSAPTAPVILTLARNPLPPAGFEASIAAQKLPTSLSPGSTGTIYPAVKNVSPVTWQGLGGPDGAYPVKLGNHWLDSSGAVVIPDDGRAALPFDLKPGEEIEVPLTITAPNTPGNYVLEIDVVQERVAWFGSKGSKTLRVNIRVE